MKLFKCDNCNNVLYFENSSCTKCGHTLGFVPTELDLNTLVPVPNANQLVPFQRATRAAAVMPAVVKSPVT